MARAFNRITTAAHKVITGNRVSSVQALDSAYSHRWRLWWSAIGLALVVSLASVTTATAQTNHPCPGVALPLTEERAVVQVGECLFQGRVVKVDRLGSGNQVVFRVRVLSSDGRVRNIDLDAATGLPTDPAILEEVNAALGR